jgi:hypothetical protein
VPLTRAWAIILAFLATACLAGMYLLSGSSGRGFTDADRAAVRAVTEAGVAALEAQLQASPVQQIASLPQDARLKDLLVAEPSKDDPDALEADLYDALGEASEELRVRTSSNMTVAVVAGDGKVMAATGAAEKEIPALVASPAYAESPADADALFSITLAERIFVAKVLRPNAKGRRIVAIESLETGAGSLLRRVLGAETPAALIYKGEMLGDIIGDQPVSEELLRLAKEHHRDAPNTGASAVFTVGDGINARIGALGRIPGPAGAGDGGAMLVVLSAHTAAASQRDLAQALTHARETDTSLPWLLLFIMFLATAGLAFYLPGIEGLGPMRRLGREFNAIAQGTQHSIFHDRYSGTAGEVARAAAAAHEALRQAYLAELEIEEEDGGAGDDVEEGSDPRSRSRTTRGGRRVTTRSHRNVPDSGRHRGGRSGGRDEPSGVRSVPREPTPPPQEPVRSRATPAPSPPVHVATPAQAPARSARTPTPAPAPAVASARPAPTPAVASARPAPAPPVQAPRPTFAPAPPPRPATPTATPMAGRAQPAVAPPASSDPHEAYYRSVYEEFLRVKTQCGEPVDKLTFDKFVQKLEKNAADIRRKKPDVDDVQFSVYVKDGKAALKAKVLKG